MCKLLLSGSGFSPEHGGGGGGVGGRGEGVHIGGAQCTVKSIEESLFPSAHSMSLFDVCFLKTLVGIKLQEL